MIFSPLKSPLVVIGMAPLVHSQYSQIFPLNSPTLQLTSVNDEMADLLGSVNTSASMRHICQRHRDILQDYTQEYCKTKVI